jgi:phage gp45-like
LRAESATFARFVRKLLAPLQRRVQLMARRAVLQIIDDTQTAQTLQITLGADELRDDAERFQGYGFTSVPASGAEAVVLAIGGSSDHPVVVAVEDRRYRPTGLAEGEVALYTLAHAKRVYLKADGTVNLGTSPTDFVALATRTESRLAALEAFALSHTHPFTAVVAGGVAAVTAVAPGAPTSPGPVAATEVKAK